MKHYALLLPLLLAAAQEPAAETAPPVQRALAIPGLRWEYKVVGIAERHSQALEYLKGALENKGVLGVAKGVDEQWAAKTEDLLNELGAEGWELEHYADWAMILKRPVE